MTLLSETLKKFDEVLQTFNLSNYRRLSSPLAENLIDNRLNELKIHSEDFRLFYKWKNGLDLYQNMDISYAIFYGGMQLSLNSIERIQLKFSAFWESSFVPIIYNFVDQYILFKNGGADFGKLYIQSPSIPRISMMPISCYDSINSLIITTIEAYEQKILHFNAEEDWLDVSVEKYFVLARSINPKSDYWKIN